jgi:hypothetical protein
MIFMLLTFGLVALAILVAAGVLVARVVGAVVRFCARSHAHAARYGTLASRITSGVLVALIAYAAFLGLYPAADFYLAELRTVSARPPPEEAKVVANDSTYPDFHGDYCSFSRIQLNERSYSRLLNELKADQRFEAGYSGDLSRGGLSADNLRPLRVVSSFARADVPMDRHYKIAFLEGAMIEVAVCVT